MIKKQFPITAMNRVKVLEYVNQLNSSTFGVITFLVMGDEPGLIAKIDRASKDPSLMISDLKDVRNHAQQNFNVQI